jgi:hypothetical protein
MEEIDEKKLQDIGFVFGDYPEMIFPLNEETSLVLVYAEGKWYGAIKQFQGLKPPMEWVYIPKDIVSMNHVLLLIACLSDFESGSYVPKQHTKLSEMIKEINQPTKITDLNLNKP